MNEYKPLIGFNILTSLKLLKNVIENFRIKLVEGMEPNQKRIKLNLENSLMLVTAIVPKVGYEKAAEIANLAFKESLNLKIIVNYFCCRVNIFRDFYKIIRFRNRKTINSF